MSASARTKSKVMSKASANAGCNVLCGTEEEVRASWQLSMYFLPSCS